MKKLTNLHLFEEFDQYLLTLEDNMGGDPVNLDKVTPEIDIVDYLKKSLKTQALENMREKNGFTTLYSGKGEGDSSFTLSIYHPYSAGSGHFVDPNSKGHYVIAFKKGKGEKKFLAPFDVKRLGEIVSWIRS